MKLAAIFQDLEHLYNFQTISYSGHFVFQNEAKILGLDLVNFTKGLSPGFAKSVDLDLSLGGSGLKFCKEDLNMAAINFSPLQNLVKISL